MKGAKEVKRAKAGKDSPLLYRVVWLLVAVISRVYWRATFEGREHVPQDQPFVLAPVHRSLLDFAVVSGITRRRMRYMAKDALWTNRLLGAFVSGLGAFPVRRGAADREAMRQAIAMIDRGEPLVMFPEGTRRSGPAIVNLHDGPAYVAIRTGVPLVPVGIGGSERALRKGSRLPRPVKIHVVVGPPIPPPVAEDGRRPSRRAVHELTQRLQQDLQALFDQAQSRAGVN